MKRDNIELLLDYALKDPSGWKHKNQSLKYKIDSGTFNYYDSSIYYETKYTSIIIRNKYSHFMKFLMEYSDGVKLFKTRDFWMSDDAAISVFLAFMLTIICLGIATLVGILFVFALGLIMGLFSYSLVILSYPTVFYILNKKYRYQFEILDRMMNKQEKLKYESELKREEEELENLLSKHFSKQLRVEKLKKIKCQTK